MVFFATTARHLETLLAEELRALGIATARETRGGVEFAGTPRDAYRACLWSRVANRVLLPLARFPAADAAALYEGTRALDWTAHLGPEQTLAVHLDSARSHLQHSHFGALKVKDAIVDQVRERAGQRPSVDPRQPDIHVWVQLFRDEACISLDLSGQSLHRRGYRLAAHAAALKETLAAAVLLRADWPALAAAGGALFDPLCGAGTLLLEGALLAADRAPGLRRAHWGFLGWRGHDAAAWAALRAEAEERYATGRARLGTLVGCDRDPAAIRAAQANAARAGLGEWVRFECRELSDCVPPAAHGLVVTNPPYGERLGDADTLPALYAQLGRVLRERCEGWHAAVLAGRPELGKRMGLRAVRMHTLFNGPIECRLLHFRIAPEAYVYDRPRPLPPAARGPGAAMFANRLRKNERALVPWRLAEGVDCYRVYDADLPEYALAIDLYTCAAAPGRRVAHVQEYAPPPTVDEQAAQRRRREALGVIGEELGIAPADLFYKVRQRQPGAAQYRRQGDRAATLVVQEDGLRFLINCSDYLDTGLFLDQRLLRRWLAQRAAGQDVLNLFGYTGTASCHAARGGARSTLTVDLSPTYCAWARHNLTLNGYDTPAHTVLQAEARDWLAQARAARARFGLILLDPPSFSNSKRMRGTFDAQRDHVALIRAAAALLAPGGELIFATPLRAFWLDRDGLAGWQCDDLAAATQSPDFARQARARHCWRIVPG